MNRNKILATLLLLCNTAALPLAAQAPKWVDKAKQAVFSVVTYDKDNKILNTGNGFFTSSSGEAMSDYSLFRGAQRAVVISSAGQQMPVDAILGINDLYDVVRFRVNVSGQKIAPLTVASAAPAEGAEIYLLPYSTQKDRSFTVGKVKEASRATDGYNYYTLSLRLAEKMASCPVVDGAGQVFGLAQMASGADTATICYAVDARFIQAQTISAFAINDASVKSIGIRKGLPDKEDDALAFVYIASSRLTTEEYADMLDYLLELYPNCSDGYVRRAYVRLGLAQGLSDLDPVAADLDRALQTSTQKDDAHYNRAKLMYAYIIDHPSDPYADWTLDRALEEIQKAQSINPLPLYAQVEGDIQYARQDYAAALACYEKVNASDLASTATWYSAAHCKRMVDAPMEETLALMDSCVATLKKPYTEAVAPYLFERAQLRMEAGQARAAVQDYDAYYDAMGGRVNEVFYYTRQQATTKARQYQRSLDDLAKAIELAPDELLYRAELAAVNISVRRFAEAAEVIQEAIKIDPNYAEGYRILGIAQVYLEKKTEACENFAKAKELGDTNVDTWIEKNCQ